MEMEEWELIADEAVDVVDEAGETKYQFHFFDFGTAYLFQANTAIEAGGACQHGFELNSPDPALQTALAEAYQSANPKIRQSIHF